MLSACSLQDLAMKRAHFCRIPYHACQPARNTGADDGGSGGQLGGARSLLQLPGEDGVQTEAGGGIGGLAEDGG